MLGEHTADAGGPAFRVFASRSGTAVAPSLHAKDGAPTVLVVPPRSKAWATRRRNQFGWFWWNGLAPDDSPLVLRDESSEEIYALDWVLP